MNTSEDSGQDVVRLPAAGSTGSAAKRDKPGMMSSGSEGTVVVEMIQVTSPKDANINGFQRTFVSLSRHRYFRLLWLGTLGSFAAMQMQQVARGNLGYELF
jgi:hypothetical protein